MAQGFKMGYSGGGGLPSNWLEERTAIAYEAIAKDAPIECRRFSDIENGMTELAGLPDSVFGGYSLGYSPDGAHLFVGASTTAPRVRVYKRTLTGLVRLADLPIGTINHYPRSFVFSASGIYLAFVAGSGTGSEIYFLKRNGDTYSLLRTVSASVWGDLVWGIDDQYLYIRIYDGTHLGCITRTGDSFSIVTTVITNFGTSQHFAISPDKNYLAGINSSYGLVMWKRTPGTNTWTKLAFTDSLPTSARTGLAFSKDGNFFYTSSTNVNPPFTIYRRNEDTFTYIANDAPWSGFTSVSHFLCTPDNKSIIAVGTNTNPMTLLILERSGDVLVRKATQTLVAASTVSTLAMTSDLSEFAISYSGGPLLLQRYGIDAGDFITNMTSIHTDKYLSVREQLSFYGVGIATQAAAQGAECKVKLFKPMNDLMAGV